MVKLYKGSDVATLVLCGDGGPCPRITIASSSAKLRDDYHGKVLTRSALIRRMAQLK